MTLAGRLGHQSFTAFYSTKGGTDLDSLGDINVPPTPGTVATRDSRHYVGYSFDQYLHQSPDNPDEGIGLFGELGISDGNPNALRWSMQIGVGGKGLIPGRSRDNWGAAWYYEGISEHLKDAVAPETFIRDEQGFELFYDFAVTAWCDIGASVQVIMPGLASTTAVVPGVRAVIRL